MCCFVAHLGAVQDAETFQPFFESVVRALTHADHAVRRCVTICVAFVFRLLVLCRPTSRFSLYFPL